MKSGNLYFLEPSGPLQACNGSAFYSLCNEAVIIPNSRTVNDNRIGKDVNGTCRGLIGCIILAFTWTNWQNTQNTSVRVADPILDLNFGPWKTHYTQQNTTSTTHKRLQLLILTEKRYQLQPSDKELHNEHAPLRTIILY